MSKMSPIQEKLITRSPYTFKAGFELRADDLGGDGIKIGLSHPEEPGAAILIPLSEIENFVTWLQGRIGRPNKFQRKEYEHGNKRI